MKNLETSFKLLTIISNCFNTKSKLTCCGCLSTIKLAGKEEARGPDRNLLGRRKQTDSRTSLRTERSFWIARVLRLVALFVSCLDRISKRDLEFILKSIPVYVLSAEAAMADMQIFVNALTGKTHICAHGVRGPQVLTITLYVKPSDTIASVKAKIQALTGFTPNEQNLWLGGQRLDSLRTLADYDIQNESTLHMDREFPEILILISSHVGPSFRVVDLMQSDTVGALKAQIRREIGIPPDRQLLIFSNSELQDNKRTLLDEHIQEGSTVFLHSQLASTAPSSST